MEQNLLKVGTFLLGLALVGMLGYRYLKNAEFQFSPAASNTTTNVELTAVDDGELGDSFAKAGAGGTSVSPDVETPEVEDEGPMLRVGVIGATPARDEVTLLREVPYAERLVKQLYNESRGRACRMLVPGATVEPPISRVPARRAGTLGRTSVLTIGLELDPRARAKLPAVTRGQVEQYFNKHRLAIQPVIYHDDEGRPYFGTDCQAAFFDIAEPTVTVPAEPMIESAVARFRALGVVANGDIAKSSDAFFLGRTLAMAFVFERSDLSTESSGTSAKKSTELLFLHLPEQATLSDLQIEAYITSDDRTTLHRLDIGDDRLGAPAPTISADIRFDKMVLLGMYPSSPVVTDMRYRTMGVLSMATIQQLCEPSEDGDIMSLSEVLDQFGKLAGRS
ncbi:hypothetical protein [Stieleria varia]|uniref:Uncharacterized protein n=1 Tax=Stieleria varia TaxID=2528005 RepID=A0A5C6B8N0_9BACT|nr:hypothetical protein [Stieleria varia]TWU08320.1 hypothetical protein Pla52n_09020 [Stieleria varia]